MIKKPFFVEGTCGEDRLFGDRWEEIRKSGEALVYLRYDPDARTHGPDNPGEYVFGITARGKQVNVCAIGSIASVPLHLRRTPEAYDVAARGAISFTIFELNEDNEQPGMMSGMDGEDFEQCVEHDEDYEVVVRRIGEDRPKHRYGG